MTKLSIVIMAHPKRKEWAEELSKQLNDCPIVWDEKNNLWDTCRRAWLTVDKSAEYGLVIQDDAIVCENFIEEVEKILTKNYVYVLYTGDTLNKVVHHHAKKGRDHFISTSITNEVALCIKSQDIYDMVVYCDSKGATSDKEITNWASRRKRKIYYTIPSLVDHREGVSLYRTINNQPEPDLVRKAVLFKKDE